MQCPYCQWEELVETAGGYYCAVCKRDIPLEELIIYDREENEKEET